jgi:hypothetical protein
MDIKTLLKDSCLELLLRNEPERDNESVGHLIYNLLSVRVGMISIGQKGTFRRMRHPTS